MSGYIEQIGRVEGLEGVENVENVFFDENNSTNNTVKQAPFRKVKKITKQKITTHNVRQMVIDGRVKLIWIPVHTEIETTTYE